MMIRNHINLLGANQGESKPQILTQNEIKKLIEMREVSLTQEYCDNDENQQECCICLDRYQQGTHVIKLLICGHVMHSECLKSWLNVKSNCPLCKRDVKEELKYIEKPDSLQETNTGIELI